MITQICCHKKRLRQRLFWGLLPVVLGIGIFCSRTWLQHLTAYFPPCVFYSLTHFYCPGCGNTRAVLALLQGRLDLAIRDNAALCYLLLVVLLLYVQKLCQAWGKPVKLLPKGDWFPVVSVCICMLYCLVRNLIPWMQPIG